jgi:hypothetical protein|tara:strand:+ start:228 stop:506 length:279 start_codon:yes stop_codon:yes gene_type:complete
MARQPIDTIRGYFEKGDVPSQGEFNDLIDSTYNATSGITDFSTGFANLSTVSLSAGEIYIDSLMGSTQSLTLSTQTGNVTLTITNGIITNIA